jgi:hypothetical protein
MEGQVANNGHNDMLGVRAGREFIQSPISWEGQVANNGHNDIFMGGAGRE